MRSFQDPTKLAPVPADIVVLLRSIDRGVGIESRYVDEQPRLMAALRDAARVESVTASSALEGVEVDPSRLPAIVTGRATRLRNRDEAELAGYTAALDYVYGGSAGHLKLGLILHLHRLLYSATDARGGVFKQVDNLVVDRDSRGVRTTRFKPVSARETPHYVKELVERTNLVLARMENHPLLVVAACVLDLTCIHPFEDGNGRVARLVTSRLLDLTGYSIGRYISIEQLMLDAGDDYYRALADSTEGWFDHGKHDPWPWTRFLLDQLVTAYGHLATRVDSGTSGGIKQDRVRDFVLLQAPATFSIGQIRAAVPGVSDNTIRLVLAELRDQGLIASDGTGRGATWHRER